ncbi:PolC-type DNA polymerase III [Eubacterium ramulus]|uniref:DNA polymerase III PolC-type n=1 Tax=Eubacterium ramulus TaxID=39490 RepID=A0A844DWQ9_EUBRA|nr:PolC-type DNA polymerase III [Eubacterium ramulus]MSC78292.1 PolC-type DNA polymerase III [Eubacterium ramulus]MSC94458.1 PolC-type DNA polymerase III [Eubacterium ramulus]MSD14719.1 PolC-type DNA polymerase III [Eubacterium ramulus]RYS97458.1 PolC-type DNA polymerase III [Eubacterium ramulus]
MAKSFFEVFPQLKLDTDLHGMLDDATVSKVSTTRQRNSLRIYLGCGRLLPKEKIYFLESELKRQLFPHHTMNIKIIEHFQLSEQYTLKNLLDVYWSSILTEFHRYSLLEYNLLRQAKVDVVEENTLRISLEDSVLAHQKEEEIYHILEKIFNERCNLSAQIEMEFHEKKESKYRKNADLKMQNEVENVIRLSSFGAKRHSEGEYLESEEAGASEVPWETGETAAKPAKKAAPAKKTEAPAAKKEAVPAGKKSAKQEEHGGFRKNFGGNRDFRERGSFKRSDNPDVIFGRDFEEETIRIEQIMGEMGEVVIRGQILSMDERPIRGEKTILMFSITDFTDTIMVKMFCKDEYLKEIKDGGIAKGAFLKIKGVTTIDRFDSELTIGSVIGIKKIPSFVSTRMDTSPVKRVELHCHTKMSDMDGVSDVKDIIKRAMKWGHKALAITDHGDVQAFPDANHAIGKDDDFKIIYGMEAYLVDDLKGLVENPMGQTFADSFVVFDLETTGFSAAKNKIIEIGAVKVVNGSITERFSTFVNPKVPIPYEIEQLTHITDDMVLDAPMIHEILPQFMEFCQNAVMVAHNADFDMSFIRHNCDLLGLECEKTVLDTVALARVLLPSLNRFKLNTIAKALNISLENHHRAVDDAACTAEIFTKFVEMLRERGIETMENLEQMESYTEESIRKLPSYHAIMLAQNDIGRVNLYRLVSDSHIKYYNRRPKIPKSEFMKYREGILLGSACEAGELYRTLLRGSTQEEVARIVQFYDYLEIQPLGNNAFMLRSDKEPIESEEDLKDINRQIVELGEQFNKLVVATCDVHFLDPEDSIYRSIIMAGKGFDDADQQAPLFLRTTEEMLKEFEYLGSEKAEEVVIENTNKIANMCEKISPVRPDKCPPVIENSDGMLREICYTRAHEIYGEELPPVVVERLERELNSIISNGFAVMYIIAQKLVWKSNEDGYLVGSRGSVGSSFVATMAGITEVNPLSPHYICSNCHYVDFDSELVKGYAGKAGCDMPDRNCPHCGQKLMKEGFDIPFETFLGFKGNKEPDIDLNFSGDYQSKAHKYTEVIFGDGQTFRAGTIGTLADKTAFGYVKHYYEERGVPKRNCEIDRIVQGCVGVRRTTGQHPGGIIVLPLGENIYSFTPVQHPANDMTTDIITTHFDYHSIDHNLLKLDILGHDDPTMIRMLQDLTGVDPQTIPLDSPEVMSLFQNTSALGIEPEDIGGCKLGALGIPEFGTDFAMQMLIDTKPQAFSDLVRIAGLSHGTDVWLGNAQTLIQEGKATISTAICTRDDIMTYLIGKGLDSEEAFTIMERVRKGAVANGKCKEWPEYKQDMLDHGVPDWYVWSCEKIKYMFPKAHAAAYVMMAWRIAWCKVFYPLAYYAAFFSIRATSFNYELMCQGKERLEHHMHEYERRKDDLSKKEQDTYKDMRIVQEMYARGFEFLPIDLYRAKAHHFQIIDDKLMPSISTIDGLGDKAADAVVEAAKDGKFLSRDDFRQRTKVSKTVIDKMVELGILSDLPESNQLSLFDL